MNGVLPGTEMVLDEEDDPVGAQQQKIYDDTQKSNAGYAEKYPPISSGRFNYNRTGTCSFAQIFYCN